MASYLRDGDRNGLPSIRKHGFLDTQPSPRRITTIENEFIHRVGTTSPAARMMASESSILHPRPSSPNRRQMTEMQEQIRLLREENQKKESLIQQLSGMDAVPKVHIRSSIDTLKHDTIYLGDRHAVETARSELAALQVKNDKLMIQIRENEAHLESKEVKIRELKSLYETSKENEAKLTTMLESYRQQILELESKAGSYETVVGRSEFTVSELQRQIRDSNDKILELESRIRKHLEERERAEMSHHTVEKKYTEVISQLSSIISVDEMSSATFTVEEIIRKMTDLVQENALLKGKIVTLNETVNSTELESKASRETIMRLVSEVGKEQKVATRFTSEIDNLRLERDTALTEKRNFEREMTMMKERLDANQRALEAARAELDLKQSRLSSLDREYRVNSEDIRKVHTEAHLFREQVASILSTVDERCDISSDFILNRIKTILQDNRELVIKVDSLEERIKTLTEQLETQYELHKTAAHRARKAENNLMSYEERLRSAEGELAAGDVLRDEFKTDKEKYLRALQRLGEKMKMDRISIDLGLDMTIDALISRAEQLVKLEQDTIVDKSTHIYNLQRKVKSLKEQLESKDLHLDLLRKKMTSLEEKLLGKSEIAKERDIETFKIRKLEKLIEKFKMQITDLKHENTNLKAQLLGSSEIQMRTMEQRKEIEELVAQVDELENVRKKQAHKIKHLKDEVELTSQQTQEKRLVSDNAVQALSSELRTSKNALNAIQNREKQLLDFRNVVARMLGLDINTLAVPDYEIISRLEKLIQAHHTHTFTTLSMEEALADMEDGFLSGYEDYRQTMGNTQASNYRRSRERVKRKAARARARSLSPTRKVDPRVY
ncbi:coiled-coil domain-containing protein 170-like [Crassostrea virginica]|uniref:Coiled-coil domain-containing protein 170-like isoform X2 n=1 Tax=Crassostrea virginica TaxID=6565 RepID=A0A8B8DU67_CRAVI|nr:coiled-coil domain-containing protein 170-like isoform X2 [Crassostrea virginica]